MKITRPVRFSHFPSCFPNLGTKANGMKSLMIALAAMFALVFGAGNQCSGADHDRSYDVVVFGGTPAGRFAAINAARQGRSVVLIESTELVGGLMTSGLSWTDFITFESLGGTFREYLDRVLAHYSKAYGPDSPQVKACFRGAHAEPKVTLKVFTKMLSDSGVEVLLGQQLEKVDVSGKAIRSITFRSPDGQLSAF